MQSPYNPLKTKTGILTTARIFCMFVFLPELAEKAR
jgi:hypothetical protein